MSRYCITERLCVVTSPLLSSGESTQIPRPNKATELAVMASADGGDSLVASVSAGLIEHLCNYIGL